MLRSVHGMPHGCHQSSLLLHSGRLVPLQVAPAPFHISISTRLSAVHAQQHFSLTYLVCLQTIHRLYGRSSDQMVSCLYRTMNARRHVPFNRLTAAAACFHHRLPPARSTRPSFAATGRHYRKNRRRHRNRLRRRQSKKCPQSFPPAPPPPPATAAE